MCRPSNSNTIAVLLIVIIVNAGNRNSVTWKCRQPRPTRCGHTTIFFIQRLPSGRRCQRWAMVLPLKHNETYDFVSILHAFYVSKKNYYCSTQSNVRWWFDLVLSLIVCAMCRSLVKSLLRTQRLFRLSASCSLLSRNRTWRERHCVTASWRRCHRWVVCSPLVCLPIE